MHRIWVVRVTPDYLLHVVKAALRGGGATRLSMNSLNVPFIWRASHVHSKLTTG